MNLYKGPWIWSERGWVSPDGSIGSIDLRPISSQSKRGIVESVGLFMTDADLPSPYQLLTTNRGEMGSICYTQLMTGFDFMGGSAHKPIFPNGDKIKVFIGDQIFEDSYQKTGAHWESVKNVIKEDVYRAYRQNPRLAQKALGYLARQHGDYEQFVHDKISGLSPVDPETTYSDDFNRADSSNLGASWTETTGDLKIVSAKVLAVTNNQNSFSRYGSSLSSADHYAQVDIQTASGGANSAFCGPCTRYNSSATTNYHIAAGYLGATGKVYLAKAVAGTPTYFINVTQTWSFPSTVKLDTTGSTLTAYVNGSSVTNTTDSSITGNLQPGIYGYLDSGTTAQFNNWVASDGLASTKPFALMGVG